MVIKHDGPDSVFGSEGIQAELALYSNFLFLIYFYKLYSHHINMSFLTICFSCLSIAVLWC